VFTVKLVLVWPACTVTLEGTVATDVLPLDRVIEAPPDGAAPLRVTVPVELFLPLTLVGFRLSEERTTLPPVAVMVSDALCELLPKLAVITAVVVVVTDDVVTVNVAVVAPEGTVTLLGTLADELLLLKLTSDPPEGAATLRVTVP
jgi:hypothetical protein